MTTATCVEYLFSFGYRIYAIRKNRKACSDNAELPSIKSINSTLVSLLFNLPYVHMCVVFLLKIN